MNEQQWREWERQRDHEDVSVQTMRVGSRMWQVRRTWRGRGTRQVRIVRTEQRRVGWEQGRWVEVRGHVQVNSGERVSEVWES